MIEAILAFSLRQAALIFFGSVLLIALGTWAAFHLPIDAVPDITNVQVQINTTVEGLAPEEVERLITIPIEAEMAGLPGLEERRSLTKYGLSQVTLVFHDGTDIYRTRQLVAERIRAVELPPGTLPELAPVTTGLGEIYYYSLRYAPGAPDVPPTEEEQLMELHDLQEYVVKPRLRLTPGVAEVNTNGGLERQYIVQPRPEALARAGMTVEDLAEVVERNSANAGGGVVLRGESQLSLRVLTRFESLDEIGGLPLKFAGGKSPLKVRDVADLGIASAFRAGAATSNGREAVLGTALMLVGENSRVVAKRVESRLQKIQAQLPPGVLIQAEYNRAELVDRTVGTVRNNLAEGAILVVAILFVFLGDWRAALIVAAAIPLSFLCAIIGMWRGGISGNLMSLGAIDFGLIIDGAVVVVENVVRRLSEAQAQQAHPLSAADRRRIVLDAGTQVATPLLFGALIIAVVYVPILSLSGVEGKMFRPMAWTVLLALGGALALSVTLLPVLCARFLRGRRHGGDGILISRLKRLYVPSLTWALRQRFVVVLGAALICVAALLVFRRLGAEFIPQLDEGSFTVMVYRKNGMSLERALELEKVTEKTLLERVPEVERVFSRIGTSDLATDPMPPSENDLYIFYKPRSQWRKVEGKTISRDDLARILEKELEGIAPDQALLFAQPIEMRFNEMLEGVRADVAVKIFGSDYDILDRLGEKARELLERIPGTDRVDFETQGRAPSLLLRARKDALERLSLPGDALNAAVETAFSGRKVGAIVRDVRRNDVVVRLNATLRGDESALKALPVRVGEMGMARLGDLVELEQVDSVEPILRDDGQRRAALLVSLEGRDAPGWVEEAREALSRNLELPHGYSIEFGGQLKTLLEARERMKVVLPVALLLIFLLVFLAFHSFSQAFTVCTGIPLALTGGVLALAVRGMPFSITAAVGLIALSGVAVLNGIVLVTSFNELHAAGAQPRSAVLQGSALRLRPVLMTALVASLGFLPMALATGPGAEVQRPLATVVIGGIISSTLLTLIVLPVLHDLTESWKRRRAGDQRAP